MKLATRFGEIEVDDQSCVHIEGGLVGLPAAKRFYLLSHREDSPFRWLQCVDEPALALAVISPMDFFAGYSFELQDADVEQLGLDTAEDAVVLATVSMDEDDRRVTTNLLGPIIVNRKTLVGKQVVLSSDNFSTRHPLFELTRAVRTRRVKTRAEAA